MHDILKTAVEAGARALAHSAGHTPHDLAIPSRQEEMRRYARATLRAALPGILEAVVDAIEAEGDAAKATIDSIRQTGQLHGRELTPREQELALAELAHQMNAFDNSRDIVYYFVSELLEPPAGRAALAEADGNG